MPYAYRLATALILQGAYCNVPYLPLLRRQCDVIISSDASADSQALWFERTQEEADKRSIDRWPRIDYRGRFPQDPSDEAEPEESQQSPPSSQAKAADRVTAEVSSQAGTVVGDEQSAKAPDTAAAASEPPLTAVNIWIGSSSGGEAIRMLDVDEERVAKTDGIALVYCPLVPGPEVPNPAETWSTWSFEYTREQTDALLDLSERNFRSGEENLRKLMRGIWRRKRDARLAAEAPGQLAAVPL